MEEPPGEHELQLPAKFAVVFGDGDSRLQIPDWLFPQGVLLTLMACVG
jgi:hypothetical protein